MTLDDAVLEHSPQIGAMFTTPAQQQIPPLAERADYKKKSGSSDTTKTKDEIVT